MRKLLVASALLLAGCSNQQLSQINDALDQYDQAVVNFNTAASRINSSIALTSQALAGYCNDAKIAGTNLTMIINGNATALGALNKITIALNEYCANPPKDISGAIISLTAIVAAAKEAGG